MAGSSARTVQVNLVGDSSKLQGAMQKAGSEAESAGKRIGHAWSGVASSLSGAFGGALSPVTDALGGISSAFDDVEGKGKRVGLVMAGIGGAGIAAGTGLQMLGSKEQAASQQLGQAFQNIGQNMSDYQGQIDHTVNSMAKFGYTSPEVKDSLTSLVSATRNPTESFKLMSTAANLAAMRHESLTSATNQLIQVIGGKGTRVLAELGLKNMAVAVSATTLASATKAVAAAHDKVIAAETKLQQLEEVDHTKKKLTIQDQIALKNAQDNVTKAQAIYSGAVSKAATDQRDFNNPLLQSQQNLDAISRMTRGQASAAADTFAGHMRALRAEIENHVAEFGQKYGPAITAASAGMTVLGGVTETVSSVIGKFKGADDAAAAAEGIKATAEAADTAAEDAEAAGATVADAASAPLIATVGLIVAAVAILGVGIYELVTHWRQVFGFMKSIAVDAWHGIYDGFISPIESVFEYVVGFIRGHWQLLLAILTGPVGLAVLFIKDHFGEILSFVEGLPAQIGRTAVHMWDGITNAFRSAIDYVIGLWNEVAGLTKFTLPSIHVGPIKIGGEHIGPLLPTLPMFAQGGIVTGPMAVGVGDNPSGKEAIVPLEKAGQMGFGGGDIVVPVTLELDGRVFGQVTARYTRDALLRGTARNSRGVGLS